MEKFKIGQVVQLKGGIGPKMSVSNYYFGLVLCDWFVEGQLKHSLFQEDQLEPAEVTEINK